jgi:hypothetical protein
MINASSTSNPTPTSANNRTSRPYHLLLQSECTDAGDIDHRGVIRFHQHGCESGRHKVRASDVYRALDGDVLAASGGERQVSGRRWLMCDDRFGLLVLTLRRFLAFLGLSR